MLNIEFHNLPRQTGKTTTLKLKFQENKDRYCNICVFGHIHQSTAELHRYCKRYAPNKNVVNSVEELRGMCQTNILVIIDEPFLISLDKQDRILMVLNELSKWNDISVIGYGTDEPALFRKYIV